MFSYSTPTTDSPDQLEENHLSFPESHQECWLGGAGRDGGEGYCGGQLLVGMVAGKVMLAVLASSCRWHWRLNCGWPGTGLGVGGGEMLLATVGACGGSAGDHGVTDSGGAYADGCGG